MLKLLRCRRMMFPMIAPLFAIVASARALAPRSDPLPAATTETSDPRTERHWSTSELMEQCRSQIDDIQICNQLIQAWI